MIFILSDHILANHFYDSLGDNLLPPLMTEVKDNHLALSSSDCQLLLDALVTLFMACSKYSAMHSLPALILTIIRYVLLDLKMNIIELGGKLLIVVS